MLDLIYKEVGQLDETHHEVEEVGIVGEVAVAHQSHVVEVGSEDACVLEDRAVLDDGLLRLGDGHDIAKPLVEEIDLEIERPPLHVSIVVFEVRIVVHGLVVGSPSVAFGQQSGEGGLSRTNVSGDSNVHDIAAFV